MYKINFTIEHRGGRFFVLKNTSPWHAYVYAKGHKTLERAETARDKLIKIFAAKR